MPLTEADDNHGLLNEAKDLENRRIELMALAIERNVADLMPETWVTMAKFGWEKMISLTFNCGLEEKDGARMSERDCRNFVAWVGRMADQKRTQLKHEEEHE